MVLLYIAAWASWARLFRCRCWLPRRLQLVSLQNSSSALLSAPPRCRTVSLVLAATSKLQTMPLLMLVATLPMVATIPVGPTLQAGVSLPVLLLAVPPTVHTLPEPMGPVATLPVGPTESLVLVPVHLIAVVGCAPVLVLEIAVPTRARATATSTVATSAAVAAAAPPALAAAAADEDGIVGTASP